MKKLGYGLIELDVDAHSIAMDNESRMEETNVVDSSFLRWDCNDT